MLPILSLMLSDAGASLMGQVAVQGPRVAGWGAWLAPPPEVSGSSARPARPRARCEFHGEQMLVLLQVLLVIGAGAGEQARVDLVDGRYAAHHGAELLAILGEGDHATLGQFEALPHALHAHVDIAAVG